MSVFSIFRSFSRARGDLLLGACHHGSHHAELMQSGSGVGNPLFSLPDSLDVSSLLVTEVLIELAFALPEVFPSQPERLSCLRVLKVIDHGKLIHGHGVRSKAAAYWPSFFQLRDRSEKPGCHRRKECTRKERENSSHQ